MAEQEQSSSKAVDARPHTKLLTYTDLEVAGSGVLITFCMWLQATFYMYLAKPQVGLTATMLVVLAYTAVAMVALLLIALLISFILHPYAPLFVHNVANFCERYPQYVFYTFGVLYLIGVVGYDIVR